MCITSQELIQSVYDKRGAVLQQASLTVRPTENSTSEPQEVQTDTNRERGTESKQGRDEVRSKVRQLAKEDNPHYSTDRE